MKHKATKRILSLLLAMVMLVGLLPSAAIPTFAAELIGRDTISSVAITVARPIAGKPLANCVPKTTLCDITCTWSVRGLKGVTEVPATTIAKAGTLYYLTMILTPKVDLYTFAAGVTGTVNGNAVTVERMSSTRIACMVPFNPVRPAGSGTEADPFRIGTADELYWFEGFVNGDITDTDFTVEPSTACAQLTSDITVNDNLLDEDGQPSVSKPKEWTPIGLGTAYAGTFDGQGYTISGIYYNPQDTQTVSKNGGLFGALAAGGYIRNLTVEDSYFCAIIDSDTGGIVGRIEAGANVKNCHFSGTMTEVSIADDEYTYTSLGGIAGYSHGTIRNCTVAGLVSNRSFNNGGIVAYMRGGEVIGCVNEARVQNLTPDTNHDSDVSGGIVGRVYAGTIRDCCNKGTVTGNRPGGIVGRVVGLTTSEEVVIDRCRNEGNIETGAGIAYEIDGTGVTVTIINCYNSGRVYYGIINSYEGTGHSITYCHNAGEIVSAYDSAPIISAADTDIEVKNCYYLANSETDDVDGTVYKTAAQFGGGTVLTLLNGGDNAGNWKQGDGYPVLDEVIWTYTVTVNGGSGSGTYEEGETVSITADDCAWSQNFREWRGADDLTFTAGSVNDATATFIMPDRNVELTAIYQRNKVDITAVRPAKGDGTPEIPFEITNVDELYWFAGFVNGSIAADGITVDPEKACAKVMNDITVNPDLLTPGYALNVSQEDTSLLAAWEPIGLTTAYKGTFDGQNHTISGIYYNPQSDQADVQYGGFFSYLTAGGSICNLTLADSYFCAPIQYLPHVGGFAGWVESGSTVENCHFDGTVTTADESGLDRLGGIAGYVKGEVRNCTVDGRIVGYAFMIGGIAAQVEKGAVIGCENNAVVASTYPLFDVYSTDCGGIAGSLDGGTIQDCCNTASVSGATYNGGIVGSANGSDAAPALITRCWNDEEAVVYAGIVHWVDIYVTIKNCYNAGIVSYGIIGQCSLKGMSNSLSYCHNTGTASVAPILGTYSTSIIEVENCYYMADSELDEIDGTYARSVTQFSIGMVTTQLNYKNEGNWKQGPDYPVLFTAYTLTVDGGTGSGTYGVGDEVTITANVPDGYVFAGWEGFEGLTGEDGITATFLMPKRNVTLTAKFVSTTPVRPAKGDGTEGNPFEISTVGELYWFAGFVNGTIEKPADITVSIEKACAKVMNDITVNRNLLTKDYALNVSGEDTDLLAVWTPIAPPNGYKGTFDGQGYAISGIYYNPGIDTAFYSTYYAGFFGCYINDGGIVRNLTLKDTYIGAPREKSTYDAGGIAGMVSSDGTVENCHFDGTVTADDTNGTYTIGGIAGRNQGVIRNCTTKGLVKGYTKGDIGGIAGKVARYTEDGGYVIGCVNEATVKNTRSDDVLIYTGGIAGELYNGNIRDCCNKGNVSAVNDPAGIVSYVYGDSSVIRCWNEGDIEGEGSAGIVSQLRATVKNCYNTGSVNGAGIVARPYSYCSITYCHNVGDADSIVSFIDSYATIENCYYLADNETDVLDGTMYKTAAEFADGTVLALLDSGDNVGNWKQGYDYPVLNENPGVTVSGTVTSFGSETDNVILQLIAEGYSEADYEVIVKGNSASYSIGDVAAGTYTLRVVKNNHVTREYTVVVGTENVIQDAKIHLKGDITGDGRINIMDVNRANLHFKKKITLTGYEFDCANITGDAQVNIMDVNRLNLHFKGKSKLW